VRRASEPIGQTPGGLDLRVPRVRLRTRAPAAPALDVGAALPVARKCCHRYNDPGHAHELTFSCYRSLPMLSRDRTRGWLVQELDRARRQTPFDLWAYVIMPEHVHILLYSRKAEYDISRILWRIKRPVGLKAITYLQRNAPDWLSQELTVKRPDGASERRFWQAGGGYDRNIVEVSTAQKVINYIHQNPVRPGLVECPEDWEWSSARWYAGFRPVPLEMDPTLPRAFEG
jgi:putative transposase